MATHSAALPSRPHSSGLRYGRSSWQRSGVGVAAVGLLSTLPAVGCRGKDAWVAACRAGEAKACQEACTRGVFGLGGCFDVADAARREAAESGASAAFQEAAKLYGRACDGGYADGCLFAAQTLETPALGALDKLLAAEGRAKLPSLMSTADLMLRERRLSEACRLGSALGCRHLGDVLVGKSEREALAAYQRHCTLSTKDVEPCMAPRKALVARAAELRKRCTSGVADACDVLGRLLHAADAPRAALVFANECRLRGVEELVGGVGAFVRRRVAEARSGQGGVASGVGVEAEQVAAAQAAASVGSREQTRWVYSVAEVGVEGRLLRSSVVRALEAQELLLLACHAASTPGSPAAAGTLELRLVIDRGGDVWQAEVAGGSLRDSPVAACAVRTLEDVTMPTPLDTVAKATVSLAFSARHAEPKRPSVKAGPRRSSPPVQAALSPSSAESKQR